VLEMRNLSFAVVPLSDDNAVSSIVPLVDGTDLTRLIDEFEQAHGYEPAGGYAGLVPTHFDFGALDLYFMAAGTGSMSVDNRRYLLGCECGELGCWPLQAHILTTDRYISWESFTQPFRPERDYSSFGPFRFDSEQYRQAVKEMAARFRVQ